MTTKVLTVKELKNILNQLDETACISIYDTLNGNRTYLYVDDIDSGVEGVIDFNLCTDRVAVSFAEDIEKVDDLLNMSKDEFLSSYSYLTDKDVMVTYNDIEEFYMPFVVWFFVRTQQQLSNDAMSIRPLAVKGTELLGTCINILLPRLGEEDKKRFWSIVNSQKIDVDKEYTLNEITGIVLSNGDR